MPTTRLDWRDLSPDRFLERHWQREPLLWRQALPGFRSPITPHDLAELACQDEADARLVVHEPDREPPWTVRHGPFDEADFDDLPDAGWTLLVQAVDAWLPEVATLVGAFDFLPSWRLDDIMVSHAVSEGGVGPHIDQYDVFLLQAAGQRRWRYGSRSGSGLAFRADLDLRILESFDPAREAILEPGDILYLPPGVAHDGVAIDDGCLTFSIGFRAPGIADLAGRFADAVAAFAEELGDAAPRYGDPGIARPADPALVSDDAVAAMTALLQRQVDTSALVRRAIGELVTEPRLPPAMPDQPVEPATVSARITSGDRLERPLGSRWAHLTLGTGALLCVDGVCRQTDADLAATLCTVGAIDQARLSPWQDEPALWSLLAELISQGSLAWHDDD